MAAQLPDRILFNGEFLNLYSNPLESYWSNLKRVRPSFFAIPDCTRGYIASWEIRKDKLLLTEIDGTYNRNFIFFSRPTRYSLLRLFPKSKSRPVKATWFSGKLRIPVGKMTLYEPTGYDSRFEKEVILTIDNGDVIKSVTLDFTEKSLIVNSEVK
jgi:hypothetical protein